MNTINRRKLQFSVFAVAVLAIATIATLLAVTSATDPAQAQGRGGGTGDDPTPSTGPLPCGPGYPDNFPATPAEVVSSGHYALFDAYWLEAPGLADDTKTGTLNNNLCPPSAKHKDVDIGGQTVEQTTRTKSDIDLRTTIIQVGDKHKADVVATNAEAGTTKLSLEKYAKVRKGLGLGENAPVPADTEVYWLRLEDTARNLPPSDLVLGFSTGPLDGEHWHQEGADDQDNPLKPFQYELESWRVLGPKPTDLPHVFTYWEPDLGSGIVWDTTETDVNAMPLGAGEYEHLEWVFTKPGTYVLSVHLKGHVRKSNPSSGTSWERISPDDTVTSVPHQYVFQVGDLHINAQPHVGYHRAVGVDAPANAHVGDPIPVYGVDHDDLEFELVGPGSDNFKVIPATTAFVGKAVQLVVSDSNILRNFGDPRQFDLRLQVKDKHDIEDNADDVIDDVAAVRITVRGRGPWASLKFLNEHPRVGDQVRVVAEVHGGQPGQFHTYSLYTISGGSFNLLQSFSTSNTTHEFTITRASAGHVVYAAEVQHGPSGALYESPDYPITWRH